MKRLATALLLFLPLAAPAQVYKCTGKDGKVTYSQTRPRDTACAETAGAAIAPTGAGSGSNMDNLMKFSKEIDRQRGAEAEIKQQAAAEAAARQQRCSMAKKRLALIDQSTHVFTIDEKGERTYGSAAQRDQMEDAARQAVARECG